MEVEIQQELFEQLQYFCKEHGRDIDLVVEEALMHFLRLDDEGRMSYDDLSPQQRWLINELARR